MNHSPIVVPTFPQDGLVRVQPGPALLRAALQAPLHRQGQLRQRLWARAAQGEVEHGRCLKHNAFSSRRVQAVPNSVLFNRTPSWKPHHTPSRQKCVACHFLIWDGATGSILCLLSRPVSEKGRETFGCVNPLRCLLCGAISMIPHALNLGHPVPNL